MKGIAIVSRPIMPDAAAYVLLQDRSGELVKYDLAQNQAINISLAADKTKYCTGWYDISTHTNHICEAGRTVDDKFESCFDCRKKTGFNPGFYHANDISSVQVEYNRQPHSVYVAYFGDGLAKAGILSDSRGEQRLYEQGALWYAYVGHLANADEAREVEARLIRAGLRNSVMKRQKELVLSHNLDIAGEQGRFSDLLGQLPILIEGEIISNLDHFFFGNYIHDVVTPIDGEGISGKVAGIIGRYLVIENGGRLYGFWLDKLSGRQVIISDNIVPIEAAGLQESLF